MRGEKISEFFVESNFAIFEIDSYTIFANFLNYIKFLHRNHQLIRCMFDKFDVSRLILDLISSFVIDLSNAIHDLSMQYDFAHVF